MFSGKEFHNLGAATIEDDRKVSLIIWQKGTKLNTRWVKLLFLARSVAASHPASLKVTHVIPLEKSSLG